MNLCRRKSNQFFHHLTGKYDLITFAKHHNKGAKPFTKVNQMSDGVQPCLNEDQDSGELVQVFSNRYLTLYNRCVLSFSNCQASLKGT